MKSPLQFLGFFLILIGCFWVGVQWGNSLRPAPVPRYPVSNQQTSVKIDPVIVSSPEEDVPTETKPSLPENTEENSAPTISSRPIVVDPNLPNNITDKTARYESSRYHYAFDLPANVYYSAFPAEGGAVHVVGISKENPPTLAEAAVRVYFYGKTILPELQNARNGQFINPEGTSIALLLNNEYSVKIEALDIRNPVVQKIVETIAVQ